MSAAVRVERAGSVATVVLDRADRGNAFTGEMIDAFAATLGDLAGDDDVRAVVITGSGRFFSTGADFTVMPALAQASGLTGALGVHAAIEAIYGAFLAVDRLPMPVVGAINGHAVGGGFGVALLCDMRVVAERAKLGANFARLGLHCGMAISHLLPAAVGYEAAAELLFTGRLIRGEEAVSWGLARRALPVEEVLPAAQALAAEIAEAAPLAVRSMKRSLRQAARRDLPAVLQTEALAQALLMQSDDAREGIQAMLAKRAPIFRGR